jgi:uncharacterized protein
VTDVMRDASTLRSVDAAKYIDERFGLPTVRDILKELEKPGRDPRPEFKTATFREGVEELEHLEAGMVLEGVVTNVTNFGAFVDVGVHHDGLVHISAMSSKFVRDPREVVKAGDIVKVKVLEVDAKRRRIALSMRLDETAGARQGDRGAAEARGGPGGSRRDGGQGGHSRGAGPRGRQGGHNGGGRREDPREDGAMAEALKRALQSR